MAKDKKVNITVTYNAINYLKGKAEGTAIGS
jgi:hypothetical protein